MKNAVWETLFPLTEAEPLAPCLAVRAGTGGMLGTRLQERTVAWQAERTPSHLPWSQSVFCSTLALLPLLLTLSQHLTLPLSASSAEMASCMHRAGSAAVPRKGKFLL